MSTNIRIFTGILIVVFACFVFLFLIPAFRGEIEVQAGFKIGRLMIRYYGLTLALAVLAGWCVSSSFASRFNLDREKFHNLLLVTVICGFLGARLLVVIENLDYFWQNSSEIYKIWHGGLAIYGGLLGGVLGAAVYALKERLELLRILDILALAVPLGQAIGRLGNFFNQEAFGPPTSLPWKMFVDPAHRPPHYLERQFFHPTFLYEALFDLAIFVLLLSLIRRTLRPGIIFGSYLAFYAAGRFFLEFFRIDSFYLGATRLNQVLSLLIFAAGVIIFLKNLSENAKNS